jgi:hypothetical protein
VLFAHVFVPLVFGLAAVWLIPWHQFAKPRWLLLLSALLACEGFSLGSLRALLKPGVDFWQPGMLYTLLAASAVSLCLAVWWTGLSCRRRPGLERFLPLLAAWQAVSWAITIMLFCVCVGEAPSLRELLPILGGFIFVYVVSLPFVILGLASPFYRERLQALLDLAPTTPAPAPVPPQAANQAPSIPS